MPDPVYQSAEKGLWRQTDLVFSVPYCALRTPQWPLFIIRAKPIGMGSCCDDAKPKCCEYGTQLDRVSHEGLQTLAPTDDSSVFCPVENSAGHVSDGSHHVVPAVVECSDARIVIRLSHYGVVVGEADDLSAIVDDVEVATSQKSPIKCIRDAVGGEVEDCGGAPCLVLEPVADDLVALEREVGEFQRAFYELCHGSFPYVTCSQPEPSKMADQGAAHPSKSGAVVVPKF